MLTINWVHWTLQFFRNHNHHTHQPLTVYEQHYNQKVLRPCRNSEQWHLKVFLQYCNAVSFFYISTSACMLTCPSMYFGTLVQSIIYSSVDIVGHLSGTIYSINPCSSMYNSSILNLSIHTHTCM